MWKTASEEVKEEACLTVGQGDLLAELTLYVREEEDW